MEAFMENCLKAHNEYRKKHGTPPLTLSPKLCIISQNWADHLFKNQLFEHSTIQEYGENIFNYTSTRTDRVLKGNEPVDSWYDEIKMYHFGQEPKPNSGTGHFTQVIWRDSMELGVGYAHKANKFVVVCHYNPPGNYIGKHIECVPPLGAPPCERKPKFDDEQTPSGHFEIEATFRIPDFKKDFLAAHNKYRKVHGVPPLEEDLEMSGLAQKWADHLVYHGVLKRSEHKRFGENIYCIRSSTPNYSIKGNDPVDNWYEESQNHNFNEEPNDLTTGHFTQIVWKLTKKIGMGYAKSGGRIIVVANYYPPGNFEGKFLQNVTKPGSKPVKMDELINALQFLSFDDRDNLKDEKLLQIFAKNFLNRHNKYRAAHGVPELKLDPQLNENSKKWAQTLAANDKLELQPHCKYGQNIYLVTSNDPSFVLDPFAIVDRWYSENDKHVYTEEPTTLKAGNFTQMIWKSTTHLGVGIAKNGEKMYLVANYNPRGNFAGQFLKSVPPPLRAL